MLAHHFWRKRAGRLGAGQPFGCLAVPAGAARRAVAGPEVAAIRTWTTKLASAKILAEGGTSMWEQWDPG